MSNFIKFLQEHRNGATHDDLSDKLRELVAAVVEEGKAGKLTLTISLKPMGKNDGLEVSADVKLAAPKPTPGVSIFFTTPESNLVRQDPRKQALELREVGPTAAARALA